MSSSGLARQHKGDVIGLFFSADPGVESQHDLSGDHMQGLVAIAADDLHHALFAKLAEVVLRLRDAVRVGDEDISRLHVEAVFVVVHAVHQTDDRSALIEPATRLRTLWDRGPSETVQATLAEFMRRGLLVPHVRRMRTERRSTRER